MRLFECVSVLHKRIFHLIADQLLICKWYFECTSVEH